MCVEFQGTLCVFEDDLRALVRYLMLTFLKCTSSCMKPFNCNALTLMKYSIKCRTIQQLRDSVLNTKKGLVLSK